MSEKTGRPAITEVISQTQLPHNPRLSQKDARLLLETYAGAFASLQRISGVIPKGQRDGYLWQGALIRMHHLEQRLAGLGLNDAAGTIVEALLKPNKLQDKG